ncbi:MAG: C39 family peptidase [Candidatus Sericytochromatia bacterium]|nr:C39 family peptidase [Candidatus Sericytochromatia bacterium]
MSFDTNKITGVSPGVTLTAAPKEYNDVAAALKAAQADDGNELVVGYHNEAGETKYALVDIDTAKGETRAASGFDPGQLQFDASAHVFAAVVSTDKVKGFDEVSVVATAGAEDVLTHAEGSLVLARAATDKQLDRHGSVRNTTVGFRRSDSNLDWGHMVKVNKLSVLDDVVRSRGQLAGEMQVLGQQIDAARTQKNPDTAAKLEARLAQVSSRDQELGTYGAILQAELLTDTLDVDMAIPGTVGPKGEPMAVGDHRKDFEKATVPLRDQRAQVAYALSQATDPAVRAGLTAQHDGLTLAITSLDQRVVDVRGAALNQAKRDMALAQIGGALAGATNELGGLKTKLAGLEAQLQTINASNDLYEDRVKNMAAVQTQIDSVKAAIDTNLSTLIGVMEKEIGNYAKHSEGGKVAKAAVDLLKAEVGQLKVLKASSGLPSFIVDAALSLLKANHAELQTSELLQTVSEGAQNWDGVSPKEGMQLLQIDADVQTYKTAYKAAKARVTEIEAKAKVPPPRELAVVPQTQVGNACGTTSLSMVLTYLKAPAKFSAVATVDDAIRPHKYVDSFTAPTSIVNYARDTGLQARMTQDAGTEDLKKILDQGLPPVILTDWPDEGKKPDGTGLHYVVVSGYEVHNGETRWTITNPHGKVEKLTNAELMERWSNLQLSTPVRTFDTGFNRLMLTIAPKDGVLTTPDGKSMPVSSVQMPPSRVPVIAAGLVAVANEVMSAVDETFDTAHDVKDEAVYVKGKINDATGGLSDKVWELLKPDFL